MALLILLTRLFFIVRVILRLAGYLAAPLTSASNSRHRDVLNSARYPLVETAVLDGAHSYSLENDIIIQMFSC